MAPCSRLEEKLRKLGLSTDYSGCSRSSPASKAKYQFRIFFPMPPYDGLQFNALRSGTGFNFTGQLLGIGGKQLQRIKQESAAHLQVNNAEGNLNGSHPDPLDPNLHALISADSVSKLQKAAMMVWELLAPVNGKFLPIDVVPGGSVRLTIDQPGKAAAAAATKTASQQKKGARVSKSESTITTSSSAIDSSTLASSTDSRPVSVSPLLTPVTPAAAAGQRPNRSGIAATPSSSCSCSETNTPGSDLGSSGSSNSSSGSNMRCLFSSLDDFSLPPAALPTPAASSDTYAGPDTPQAQRQQQQQQQQVMTTDPLRSSDAQEDQILEPATPCSGPAAAGPYTSEPARTQLRSQPQQQQQQQEAWPLPSSGRTSCSSMPRSSVQELRSGQQALADNSSNASGGASGAADPAGTPVPAAPCETAFPGAAGAAAAEACLLPPGAVLQKPEWQQQQQQLDGPVLGLDSSADGSSSSCFQYGLGLSSTSLDSSSSFCAKASPALQAFIVDHQRQQQQQMAAEQQMQLIHMVHLQQQAQAGSFGSSQSAFGSSASLFGGPSPLLGPRTSSFAGSFESDSLQLGPNALMHIAGSSQGQLGLQGQLGMRPAGIGTLNLGAAPAGGHASGAFACSMGLPESPRFAATQLYCGAQPHEPQQHATSALHRVAASDSLSGSFEGSAGLNSNSIGRYTSSMHAGSVLSGLHLPGCVASCWTAGPNELPSSPMLFGTPLPSAAAFGNATGSSSGASGDVAHSNAAGAGVNGAGLAKHGSVGRGVLPPAWLQAQHEAEQQQQHDMMAMVHGAQQLHATHHEQRMALPMASGAYSGHGASLAQPGRVSIW